MPEETAQLWDRSRDGPLAAGAKARTGFKERHPMKKKRVSRLPSEGHARHASATACNRAVGTIADKECPPKQGPTPPRRRSDDAHGNVTRC